MKNQRRSLPFAESARTLAATFLDTDPDTDPAIAGAVAEISRLLSQFGSAAVPIGVIAAALDNAAILATGRPLRSLDSAGRARVLRLVEKLPLTSEPLWLASALYKLTYYLQDGPLKRTGSRYGISLPKQTENPRWMAQIQSAAESESEIEMEAEAIVIGTGAGGAAAAYELASRGVAVAMVEAGDHYHRAHFDGKYLDTFKKIYRFYPGLGNGLVTILAGQSVGGTTTINSGTCFRTPEHVLQQWRKAGLNELSSENLAPYFAAVEEMLHVEEATAATVGPLFDVVKKGASELGLHDVHRLHRNAQGCDGQGLCQFGCPTAAKRSTDVSYVPAALEAGAFLYAGFQVSELARNGNQITGIVASGRRADGSTVRLRIKAPNVIVSMGTIKTPVFLLQQGVRNPHLGKHLTIHPAGAVGGIFDDIDFKNERSIPQGVGIGDLAAEGIRFEGGTPPLSVYAASTHLYGRPFREVVDAYRNTAFMGFMVSDAGEGRVRVGPKGTPLVTYWVDKETVRRYSRGTELTARMMFRAGAKKVNMFTYHRGPLANSERDVDAFSKRKHHARDFNITAYHPLGTARLGASQADGVCDSDHKVYGYEGLYVMDGSNVPSALGVNPQITIMTLASRAAANLAKKLSTANHSTATAV